jgi:hypothetical protein
VTHIHNGIQYSLYKEGNPAICDNMDEADDYILSEILYDLTYM